MTFREESKCSVLMVGAMIAVIDVESADDLWTRGAGHLIGAKALAATAREDAMRTAANDVEQTVFNGKYSASIHLLIGFAFELLLKSAFILNGGNARELSVRGIGHDLLLALDKAEGVGFTSSDPRLRLIAERLRESHLSHQFRYGGLDKFHMPELSVTLLVLETLIVEIRQSLSEHMDH